MLKSKRIKRSDFEGELIEKYGHKNLVASGYDDLVRTRSGGTKIQRLTLYYLRGKGKILGGERTDVHVATWGGGEGWYVGTPCDSCEGLGVVPSENGKSTVECPKCHGATVV
jgi:hypothetical protein